MEIPYQLKTPYALFNVNSKVSFLIWCVTYRVFLKGVSSGDLSGVFDPMHLLFKKLVNYIVIVGRALWALVAASRSH